MGQLQDPIDCLSTIFGTSSNLRLAVGGSRICYNKSSYTHSQTFQKSFRDINNFISCLSLFFRRPFVIASKRHRIKMSFMEHDKAPFKFCCLCTVPQCTVCVVNVWLIIKTNFQRLSNEFILRASQTLLCSQSQCCF